MTEFLALILILAAVCVSAVCIYLVFKYVFGRASRHDEDSVLDHIAISGQRDYRKKLARAIDRHGKQPRAHTKVSRVETPSRKLQELEAASREAMPPENVSPLRKSTKEK